MTKPYRILCVCMANVVRSPVAEAVLRSYIAKSRLAGHVEVSSAGTHGFRVGEYCDRRTQDAAWARGYDLSQHQSVKIGWQDFDYFDLILAMDKFSLNKLRNMATDEQQARINLFMNYAKDLDVDEVPDPYMTLGMTIEKMLDMVELGAVGVINELEAKDLK